MSKKSEDSESKQDGNQLQDLFGKLQPYIETLIDLYAKLAPYIDIGKKYFNMGWKKVEPYYKKYWKTEYIEIFIGFLFQEIQFISSISVFRLLPISVDSSEYITTVEVCTFADDGLK